MEELEIEGESQTFLHDGTERPIQRPKDEEQQKEFYSGKKGHTLKNTVLSNQNCKVIYLTETVEGKKHDKKLADESHYQLPAEVFSFKIQDFKVFLLRMS